MANTPEKKPLDPNKVATLITVIIGLNIGLIVLLYPNFTIPRLLYVLMGLIIINGLLLTAWILNNSKVKLFKKDITISDDKSNRRLFWIPFIKRLLILLGISSIIWLALSFIISMDMIYAIPVSIGLSLVVIEVFSKKSTLYPD